LVVTAFGMIGAGLTIQFPGMTSVFVPTDLAFMEIDRQQLNAINPRLIPLIAHDRAGFGGAVTTAGMLTLASVWYGNPSRSLWQALAIGGVFGWTPRFWCIRRLVIQTRFIWPPPSPAHFSFSSALG
jgi:hypothetical protein